MLPPPTLRETNTSHPPWSHRKGKDRLPTIHVQVLWLLVSRRVVIIPKYLLLIRCLSYVLGVQIPSQEVFGCWGYLHHYHHQHKLIYFHFTPQAHHLQAHRTYRNPGSPNWIDTPQKDLCSTCVLYRAPVEMCNEDGASRGRVRKCHGRSEIEWLSLKQYYTFQSLHRRSESGI